jgi:hypothetical protein
MRGAPIFYSLSALILGIAISVTLLIPGAPPFFGPDLDRDGVSDTFQRVREDKDYRLGPDGGWISETTGYRSEPNIPLIAFTLVGSVVAFPVMVHLVAWRRKEGGSKASEDIERMMMHDTVRRIAAFMEVNPSLISALRNTYASMPEAGRRSLGGLLWAVRSRGNDFMTEFARFRDEWALHDPLVAKALSDLRSAEKEPTPAEVSGSARRAMDELTEGSRREMASYVHSLQGPATALFGIGVLLPVLMAAMMPISGIGSGSSLYMVAFLLWVAIPAGILFIGNRIISKRPRFMMDASIVRDRRRLSFGYLPIFGAAAGSLVLISIAIDLSGIAEMTLPWPGLDGAERTVLSSLWGFALLGASMIMAYKGEASRKDKHLREVERKIPDLLQSMGASISDGLSFEGALKRSMSDGLLDEYRSVLLPVPGYQPDTSALPPQLENAYNASRYFARSGPESGGRAIRALGSHFRGLLSLEDEMSQRIGDSVGQMEVTSSIFAPVMIGASVGIFRLLDPRMLSDGISLVGGGMADMPSSAFMVLSGVYLMLLSIASTLTISRLRSGSLKGGWERVPLNIMKAIASFSAGALISIAVIG